MAAFALIAGFLGVRNAAASGTDEAPWEEDWASAEGFALERIAVGLELPTAVIVADTPLGTRYLVTELGGVIRAVSATGDVQVFASVLEPASDAEEFSETGLTGICLDPDNRYLFVTYAKRDEKGILRNSIHRYELGPQGVAASPIAEEDISGRLHDFASAQSHQIGGCRAQDGNLYVSVGDGWNVAASGDPNVLLGKILRLDYNGGPAPGNPLADDPDENRSYVWAYGFRNPFGIELVGSDVFVAHNGHDVDALLRIEPGADYQWAGSDATISINALNVWVPSIGPTNLAYADESVSALGPDWNGGFYVGSSHTELENGLSFVPYDPATGRVDGARQWAIQHIDRPGASGPEGRPQLIAAVAVEPAGVIFAGLFPESDGETALYRLRIDPENELPNRVGKSSGVTATLEEFGCLECHQHDDTGGNVGPHLDQVQLEERLETVLYSAEYEQAVRGIDALTESPWIDFAEARTEVLDAEGKDRLLTWIKYRIMEPRFDRVDAQMPTLGISEDDAAAIADLLIADELPWWRQQAISIFGSRESANWFILGAAAATVAVTAAFLLLGFLRRRRRRRIV